MPRTSRRRCATDWSPSSTDLKSADDAADWVHKNLAAKNTLITADADAVEAGFREKLATIEVASAARQEQPRSAPAEVLNLRLGSHFHCD